MTLIEENLYLPGENDAEVWEHIEDYVNTKANFSSAVTQGAVLSCIRYEQQKIKASLPGGLNIPNAPFAVPRGDISTSFNSDPTIIHALKRYNDFISIINFLVNKDIEQKMKDGDDAVRVEEGIYKLSKLLNSHKLSVFGHDLALRDTPLNDPISKSVPVKVHAECRTNNGRQLVIRWDVHESEKYHVKVFKKDKTSVVKHKTGCSGGIVRVTVKEEEPETEFYVCVWLLNAEEPKHDKQGPFYCPKSESLMNKTQGLYDVDKFRLDIDGQYKTIFDLLELLKISPKKSIRDALEELSDRISLATVSSKLLDWEHLKIPIGWKELTDREKTLVILQHSIDSRIVNGVIDNFVDSLLPDNILKTPYEANRADGGTQRMSRKRKKTETSSFVTAQTDASFNNYLLKEKKKEEIDTFENGSWKGARDLLKRYDRIDGRRWHPCCYLETSVERNACSRLRRIERQLILSHERGYPVIEKSIAAPYEYTTSTTHRRFTTFGVNNYDRTQIFPQVQQVPYVLATEGTAKSSRLKIVDPQKSFQEQKHIGHGSTVDVLKNGNFFDHPLYPSAKKKKALQEIMSYSIEDETELV